MNLRLRHILAFAVLLGLLAGMVGCDAYPVEQARADRDAIAAGIAQVDAEIAKLPPGDPVRVRYEKHREDLNHALAIADGILRAAESGDLSGLGNIPVVGPYAGLAVAVGGFVWQFARRVRERKALKQVVASVEAAFPEKSPEQKLAMAAVQDETTRRIVHELKPVEPGKVLPPAAGV